MGLLLIGIVLGIILMIAWIINSRDIGIVPVWCVVMFVVVVTIISYALFAPPLSYTEFELVNEIQLVSLNDSISSVGEGSMFYVKISAQNAYSYYYETTSEFSNEGDKVYTSGIVSGDVIVIENNSIDVPVLQVYEKHGKSSFWSLALRSTICQYVFRVPEGSVVHQFEIGN